jgi:hypothetical protein
MGGILSSSSSLSFRYGPIRGKERFFIRDTRSDLGNDERRGNSLDTIPLSSNLSWHVWHVGRFDWRGGDSERYYHSFGTNAVCND